MKKLVGAVCVFPIFNRVTGKDILPKQYEGETSMDKLEKKLINGLKWALGGSFIALILFFIIGQSVLPDESGPKAMLADTGTINCQVFESEWERLLPNGTRYPVEVPGKYESYSGEGVSLLTTLPDEVEDQTWLCFQGHWQDMEFYIDGILRERYSTRDTRPFGRNSAIAFVFVELSREDAGKMLKVVTNSESSYSGTMNTVYIGDKFGIWITFLDWYGGSLLLEGSMLLLAIVGIGLCLILMVCYRKNFDLLYMCFGVFFAATWLLSETEFRQLLFSNVSVVTVFTFVSLMLLPISIVFYINGVQHNRYRKIHLIPIVSGFINLFVAVLLQITNQKDFLDTLLGSHIVIGISSLSVLSTIIMDCKKGYVKEYALVAFGLFLAIVGALVEVFSYYGESYETDGRIFCMGLMLLLVLSTVKTIQDILRNEKAKQRAIIANESKAKFLANMSHEIRTPINTILGMNEMILRENRDEFVQEYARNIQSSGKMLLALISDVLDFSRIEAGEVDIQEVPYQVTSLLHDSIQSLHARADKKKLNVIINIDQNLPCMLSGDVFRIRQVITNLLSNAVKYTKQGSITLTVKGERNEKKEFVLYISVKDTGIGIRKEDIDKLFESFTRMEEKRNRAIAGTGLGLTITKALVDLMHGEIHVTSVYGEGSEFVVCLPQTVVDDEAIGEFEERYVKKSGQPGLHKSSFTAPDAKILAVDDNEMNLAVLQGLLKGTEIQLDTVPGGMECLALCREKRYDMILMDHMMPTPDGIETLHMLREDAENLNRETKVIALTANALAGCREEYLKEGFDDYLSKPVDVIKLEKMICEKLPQDKVLLLQFEEDGPEEQENVTEELNELQNAFIDVHVGLTYCGGSKEMYAEILKTYVAQEEKYGVQMPRYYQEKDWKNYGILAHALKSTSLGIGAKELSEYAKRMELAAKAEDEEVLLQEAEGLQETYQTVLEQAHRILVKMQDDSGIGQSSSTVETAIEMSKEEQQAACEKLLDYIRAYEMSEALEQIEKIMVAIPENADLEAIKAYVEDYDYDSAEEALLIWMK
ncbi:MAG: response regulator [Lachnospiraceae bacterium]|nr:response regulator [Lachnospiraceae bacterium]